MILQYTFVSGRESQTHGRTERERVSYHSAGPPVKVPSLRLILSSNFPSSFPFLKKIQKKEIIKMMKKDDAIRASGLGWGR